jgi:flagellar hook-associated protein 1 FlgK
MSAEISLEKQTDVGKLKGLVLQRGTETTKYTDIPVKEKYQDASGNWTTGSWTIDGVNYTGGEQAYNAATEYYNDNISESGLMNTLSELDQLIHGVVTKMNDIFCPNTTMTVAAGETWTDANGNTLTVGDTYDCLDQAKAGKTSDGAIGKEELFSRSGVKRYTEYTYTDGGGTKHTAYIYNKEDVANATSLYTTDNLEINPAVKDNIGELAVYTANGAVDYEKAKALYAEWSKGFATLNPSATAKSTFQDYYSKLVSEVGNVGSVYKSKSTSAETTVSGLDADRQMVMGVSSDEELSNMIKFQNAYNAASRYMNVVSEMLEHIVTALGN